MENHRQLLIISGAVFLLMLGDGMVMALLPKAVISLTNSSVFVGYLASTYALPQVMSQLPIGLLADRYGAKFFILLGYMLSFLAGLLFYFTDKVEVILGGRVLQGIAEAPLLSLAPALLSLRYAADKGKAIGIYNAAIYVGLTIGPLLRVVFLPQWQDREVFLLYAILCLGGAVLIAVSMKNLQENKNTANESIQIKNLLPLTKQPEILAVLWGITLYGAGFGIFITIIPAFMLLVKGYDQAYVNLFFSLLYVAISVAQVAVGWLSDTLGRQVFMTAGMLIAAAGFMSAATFNNVGLMAILCLSSLGLGAYYIASMAYLNEKVPGNCKGAISSVYYLCWGVGMFGGPLLLNEYIRNYTYAGGFLVFSFLLMMQAVLILAVKVWRSCAGRTA